MDGGEEINSEHIEEVVWENNSQLAQVLIHALRLHLVSCRRAQVLLDSIINLEKLELSFFLILFQYFVVYSDILNFILLFYLDLSNLI